MTVQEEDTRSIVSDIVRQRQFIGYVNLCLRRYSARWMRAYRTRARREPAILDETVRDEEGGVSEVINRTALAGLSAEDAFLSGADLDQVLTPPSLYRAYTKLTETQRLVLVRLMVHEWRQEEIAVLLHVSQQAVCKAKAQALKRLRSAI